MKPRVLLDDDYVRVQYTVLGVPMLTYHFNDDGTRWSARRVDAALRECLHEAHRIQDRAPIDSRGLV